MKKTAAGVRARREQQQQQGAAQSGAKHKVARSAGDTLPNWFFDVEISQFSKKKWGIWGRARAIFKDLREKTSEE
jgi:hypothetical protein